MGINHKVIDQKFDEDSVIETDPVLCSKLIVEGKNKSARALLSTTKDESFPVLTADTLVFTPSRKIVGKPKIMSIQGSFFESSQAQLIVFSQQ